ncbi:MAG: HD domain-containing protein [Oscillospiraceae bacterium]|nr:HD domain-containing protein [Oscillospiraceae bacterium]
MKYLSLKEEQLGFFNACLRTLSKTTSMQKMDAYLQHGRTSCLLHSIAVAYYSYWLAEALNVSCNAKSLIAGAMLHDYFLYDWHEPDAPMFHGFRHPGIALRNAKKDVKLNEIECNIIQRHMFPMTPKPPRYRESVMVCLMDKLCSIVETLVPNPYARLKRECLGISPLHLLPETN